MKKRSTGTVEEANTVFHPNAQTWFNDGVGAINACLQPLLVHEFAITHFVECNPQHRHLSTKSC